MSVENLKSTAITNADASPIAANTAGTGAASRVKITTAFVTVSAAASVGSTYQLVRLPSNAIVKQVLFEAEAMAAGQFDLSVYYSDSTTDGTAVANQGLVVPSTGSKFFASVIDCTSAVALADKTNQSGNYTMDKRNKRLWDALGLTADPGGNFDIVAVVASVAVTTGAARLGIYVNFCE